jgi:hypothetical protein
MADYPADAQGMISVKQEGSAVRASVLFGAISAEATYEDGYGCIIAD